MNCKNCKHWERQVDDIYESINIYTGTKSIDKGDFRKQQDNWKDTTYIRTDTHVWGHCDCPKFVTFFNKVEDNELGAHSYDNDHSFITGENFGCIHFENKLAQVTEKL